MSYLHLPFSSIFPCREAQPLALPPTVIILEIHKKRAKEKKKKILVRKRKLIMEISSELQI